MPRASLELPLSGKAAEGPGVGLLALPDRIRGAIDGTSTRVQNPRKIFDTVADNGAAAGSWWWPARRPVDIDLRWVGGVCTGTLRSETSVSAGVGYPALSVFSGLPTSWRPLAACSSRATSCCRIVHPAGLGRKGDTLHADFGPLGSGRAVRLDFATPVGLPGSVNLQADRTVGGDAS
jgi:2-oxo-hept-3-ene-1,7-dioate hydratase